MKWTLSLNWLVQATNFNGSHFSGKILLENISHIKQAEKGERQIVIGKN